MQDINITINRFQLAINELSKRNTLEDLTWETYNHVYAIVGYDDFKEFEYSMEDDGGLMDTYEAKETINEALFEYSQAFQDECRNQIDTTNNEHGFDSYPFRLGSDGFYTPDLQELLDALQSYCDDLKDQRKADLS